MVEATTVLAAGALAVTGVTAGLAYWTGTMIGDAIAVHFGIGGAQQLIGVGMALAVLVIGMVITAKFVIAVPFKIL